MRLCTATTCPPIAPPPLAIRVHRSRAWLAHCTMCQVRCGVDRSAVGGRRGPCGLSDRTWSYKRHLSFAEEPELLPAYMVYLSGCNMRCSFCIQGPSCFDPERGEPINADALAVELHEAVADGAKSIVLVGGEPSLHAHSILELALAAERRHLAALPLALKTNMYMARGVLDLLQGVIQMYVADFKFGNDACARRLAGVEDYLANVAPNLLHVAQNTPLLVRHLLMPGHVACCFEPVARWVAANLPPGSLRLMTGYVPAWRAVAAGDELARALTADEIRQARQVLRELKLTEEMT